MRRLIVGCGYLGARVAAQWQAAGDRVWVLTRSEQQARHFENQGFQPLIGDVTSPSSLAALPEFDTLVWSVGFDRTTGQEIHEVYVDGLRNLVAVLPPQPGRFIYISSTGVYGNNDGRWVDESTPCHPQRAGGRACLQAEQLLRDSAVAGRLVILRLAGLYGPQRLPRARQLVAGQPLDAAPDGMLNLIHVEDAAGAVTRVADMDLTLPRLFVIADGQPVRRSTFYQELARQLGTAPPRFDVAASESTAHRRSGANKRVDSRAMRGELGVTLRYPSYREGLAQIIGQSEEGTDRSLA